MAPSPNPHTPSAQLGPNGERPSDDDIYRVHNDGRCFDDNDTQSPQQQYEYTASDATHHGFEAFETATYLEDDGTVVEEFREAYQIARQIEDARQERTGHPLQEAAEDHGYEQESPDLQASHDDLVERGYTGMSIGLLRTPACKARGTSPSHVRCFQCGIRPGWDLQMPSDTFETAWRSSSKGWGETAVCALMTMARLLGQARDAEVVARCCVCNDVDCLIRAGLMPPEWRIEWLDGERRPQEQRETARKYQVVILERNIRLFHDLVKGQKLVLQDVQHLMRFVAMNSQFVQEREKRFIATAMAVADNENSFGYRFADPQRFVNRMANFIHGYVIFVLVPHIMDCDTSDSQWEAHLQKLIDTALPKAPDAIYALMVESNAEQGNFEREPAVPLHEGFDPEREEPPFGNNVQTDGRLVHRVGYGSVLIDLFDPDTFLERLNRCVRASPHYDLEYASSSNRLENAGNVYEALRVSNSGTAIKRFEIQVAMRALNGPYNRLVTLPANGVAELPSSGDLQRETNVHPRLRYHNLFVALGNDVHDTELRVSMMLEYHANGNLVGKEPLRSGLGSKACYTIRRPSVGVTLLCDTMNPPTLKAARRLDARTTLPALYVLGSNARQSRAAMNHTIDEKGSVSSRAVKTGGEISLLGTSIKNDSRCHTTCGAAAMTTSARNIARVLDPQCLPVLPIPTFFECARAELLLDPTTGLIGWEEQERRLDDRVWELWWLSWDGEPGNLRTSRSVRLLVRSLNEANVTLNDFSDEWGAGPNALTEQKYDVESPGLSGNPSTLHSNLSVMHDASLGHSPTHSHRLVQYLLSSYHIVRTYAIIFLSAYESRGTVHDTVRDVPAHLHAHTSSSVNLAIEQAIHNADMAWSDFDSSDGITRSEFETIGPARAWAIQRKKRQKYMDRFQSSGYESKRTFCKDFGLDFETSLADPEKQDRLLFSEDLKRIADDEHDRRVDRIYAIEKTIALAKQRHADPLRKKTAGRGETIRVRRTRLQKTTTEPQDDRVEQSLKNAIVEAGKKRISEHGVIDRFADGENIEALKSKFDAAMRIKHGGMSQNYIVTRTMSSTADHESEKRRVRAASLANSSDSGLDGACYDLDGGCEDEEDTMEEACKALKLDAHDDAEKLEFDVETMALAVESKRIHMMTDERDI